MKSRIAALLTLVLASAQALASSGPGVQWIDTGVDKGVTMYESKEAINGFKGFKATVKVNAPMKTVLALVLVRETFPNWVANMIEDSTLPDNNPDASLCYMWIKGTWPASDRDVVCKVNVEQDPQTLAVSVVAQDTNPTLVPPKTDRVRMSKLYSGFTLRPISATQTEVQFEAVADPSGNVPAIAANLVGKAMPRDTLINLTKLVETPGSVDLSQLETNKFALLSMKKIKLPN